MTNSPAVKPADFPTDNPAADAVAKAAILARLRRLLTQRQIRVLVLSLEGLTATEIAKRERRPRRTVADWIASAKQRLEDAQIPIRHLPTASGGREVVSVEPAALDRLVRSADDATAKWIDSEKTSRRE